MQQAQRQRPQGAAGTHADKRHAPGAAGITAPQVQDHAIGQEAQDALGRFGDVGDF
jgi:hypothetical protein